LVLIALFAGLIAGVRKTRADHRLLFVTALAVFINVFLQSLSSSDFWIEAFSVYFWIIMALPFALYWRIPEHSPEVDREVLDDEATEPRNQALVPAGGGSIPRVGVDAIDEGVTS